MNNYEQEANVILKMTKVVHPDYVVNSIAQFLKERDTKQKLNIHSVVWPESDVCDICDNNETPKYKMCDKHWSEYQQWKSKQ